MAFHCCSGYDSVAFFVFCFVGAAVARFMLRPPHFFPKGVPVIVPAVLAERLRRFSPRFRTLHHPDTDKPFSGRVRSFPDGDGLTVDVAGGLVLVRLYGCDAPEWGQLYARQSWLHLQSLVWGKPVTCYPITRDKYGRLVCDVYGLGPVSLSLMQVLYGFAWHYTLYAPQDIALRDAQRLARINHRGLWRQPHPTPPWAFRHSSKIRRSFSDG